MPAVSPATPDGVAVMRGDAATMPVNDDGSDENSQIEISNYALSSLPMEAIWLSKLKALTRERFCVTYVHPFQATVSRRTSSMVVTPFRIFCSPESRSVIMPSSTDFFLSSSEDAPIKISSRISSVISITS